MHTAMSARHAGRGGRVNGTPPGVGLNVDLNVDLNIDPNIGLDMTKNQRLDSRLV